MIIENREYKYIGKSPDRVDSFAKITGEALFASDMYLQGMLFAKVKPSPYASAKIKKIDISKARALTGVRAVLTGEDLNYRLGLYVVDKYILARDMVRYQGEGVAAVAADTEEIAREALDLIEVEYEEQEAVLDVKRALEKDSPLVHPELGKYKYVEAVFSPRGGTNIVHNQKIRKGDIEKGFKEADLIVEREYTNPSVQHVPMETHVSIVKWEKGDKVTIWTSAQSPFTVRNLFCYSFGLPHNNVRVIVPYVGGGFGGKAGINLEPLTACLSRAAGGRPVKLQATREEEFNLLPCRSGLVYKIKTGVKKNGKIVAQKMEMLWDAGAYADYAVNVTRASGYSGGGPYEIPNAWLDAFTVYTNKVFGTAYRGFGHVEFFWGLERHMDYVADKLGIDPVKFRKLNTLKPGSVTLTGETITDHTGNVTKCIEEVAKAINYGKKTKEEKDREKKAGKVIGKAVCALHKAPAIPPFTGTVVILKMNEDGSVIANLSLVDYGAGTYTSIAQIIAEELSIPIEKVKIALECDTDRDPYDWQTVASKGLILSGNAAILAARDMLDKMYDVAAQVLRASKYDLRHKDGKVYVVHRENEFVTYQQMAVSYAYPDGRGIGGPIVGVGRYVAQGLTNLDKETGQGNPALDWTYGAHGLVLEVDKDTGEFDVIKIASSFDVGKVINEKAVRGQCIGGMLQGLGTATCEGYIYDKKGKLLNNSFTDNKIPTVRDVPEEVVIIPVETPQLDGPFGARGVGEHPMISVAPAVGNALKNALGIELTHMPIRAEDVWRALKDK
ncbi:MAG TPA: xanthine dehydrogenase family protein molybdopterin-binding subunit [Candidatus Eremiobacteraeota bacterium]|nr:MAG: 4-hydroxybenzoyl-CoA reductase subunit alpha [bacterium ADurb.Bin363]HPZ10043.1 xanthine dehydrogenase family protein molybdopterin-binding subunit [Candidatus Eremiobacteraeota bacterium]